MNKQPNPPRRFAIRAIVVACAASLAACASPIVRWQAPSDIEEKPQTLTYARAYAATAREAYRSEIASQFNASNNLGAGLIGLGSLVAALAAGSAHRDAILGTTLLGGTAYGVGQWNLRPQRLLIYQAGVEGMNCALAAVIPLSMSDTDLGSLRAGLADIEARVGSTNAAIDAAAAALAPLRSRLEPTDIARDEAILAAAADAVVLANKVLPAGRQLAARVQRLGLELISTVDRIAAAVDKAVQSTLPDLTSVPKIVAGLAGNAGSFAPGSGVEASLKDALASARITPKSGSVINQDASAEVKARKLEADELETKLVAVDKERRELLAAVAGVQARISAVDSSATADALKSCGVADLPLGLKLTADKLSFPGGTDASKAFVISGGNKPYVLELLDSPVDGLSVKGPVPGESRAQVSVTQALTSGSFSLLVMDSSAQMQTQKVSIEVGAQVAGITSKSGLLPSTGGPLQQIVQAIKQQTNFTVNTGGKSVGLTIAKSPEPRVGKNQNTIELTLTCDTPLAQPLSAKQVRDAVVAPLPASIQALLKTAPLGNDNRNLHVSGAKACIGS